MEFRRDRYVRKLIERRGNGLIKIITGVRRAGKSYLMNILFRRSLKESGVDDSKIISFAFDSDDDLDLLEQYYPDEVTKIPQKGGGYVVNSKKFRAFIRERAEGKDGMLFLLDEVQMLEDFVTTLNGLLRYHDSDTYVTGSNSRFLSSDISTEFRGRGSVVHVFPLTFSEYLSGTDLSPEDAWKDYIETGGIPIVARMGSREERMEYLRSLCEETYLKDIVSHNSVRNSTALSDLFDVTASMIGSSVNPKRIADTFGTVMNKDITDDTVADYIGYFEDAFLLSKVKRYDVKGRKYIGTPYKIYFEDIGIRNARLNFRQMEETHIMENIIYNELRYRGFNVDAGQVDVNERTGRIDINGRPIYSKKHLEVDFIATAGDRKYYIQSDLSVDDPDKRANEERPFINIDDSFTKIIVTKNRLNAFRDEKGVLTMDLFEFLTDPDSLVSI